LKILALAGAGFLFLALDVLLLALVVLPLAASTRQSPGNAAPAAAQSAELALLLPTLDPRTPWLIFPSTLEPTTTLTSTENAGLLQGIPAPGTRSKTERTAHHSSTLLPVTPATEMVTASPRSSLSRPTVSASPTAKAPALVTTPTATGGPAAMPLLPTDAGDAISPVETPRSSETSVAGASETATAPTETPSATPTATPVPTAPATLDDLPDFETFVRTYRNTIAGQPFDVVSLGVDRTDAALPSFVLQVAGTDAKDVFAAQSPADVIDYGHGFLDDARRYLGGAYCAVAVESTYQTTSTDACSSVPTWCRVGAQDPTTNTWEVTWTYVRGSFTGGSDTLQSWNSGS
jgi:hypothetical protein